MHIFPIFEGNLDFAARDFAVEELAFFEPLVYEGDVLALVIVKGGDVACLIALLACHGDVACDRGVPVAFLVPKLRRGVGFFVNQVTLFARLVPKFVRLNLGIFVHGVER